MAWRPLQPGETDHEAIWLGVSVAAAGVAWTWSHFALPTPQCPLRTFAHFPCPTCGATRCVVHFLHGEWAQAFAFNPIVFAALVAVLVFDLYAVAVLVRRAPRWRWSPSARGRKFARFAALAAVLANWAWLIRDGR